MSDQASAHERPAKGLNARAVGAWATLLSLFASVSVVFALMTMHSIDGNSAAGSFFFAAILLVAASAILFSRLTHGRFTIFGGVVAVVIAIVAVIPLSMLGAFGWSQFPNEFWSYVVSSPYYVYDQWTAHGLAIAAAWCVVCVLLTSVSGLLSGAISRRILGR